MLGGAGGEESSDTAGGRSTLMQGGSVPCRTTLRVYGVRLRDRRLRRMSQPVAGRKGLEGGDCTEGALYRQSYLRLKEGAFSRQSQPEGGGWWF